MRVRGSQSPDRFSSRRSAARGAPRTRRSWATANRRLATFHYTGGVSSYLEMLDSEPQQFDAELGGGAHGSRELVAVIRLYKALGAARRREEGDEAPVQHLGGD